MATRYVKTQVEGAVNYPGLLAITTEAEALLAGALNGNREAVLFAATSSTAAVVPLTDDDGTLSLADGDHIGFFADIIAAQTDGSMGFWSRRGAIKREGATTSLTGSVHTIGTDIADTNIGSPTIAITADDDNDRWLCTVTPANSTPTSWKIVVSYVLLNY